MSWHKILIKEPTYTEQFAETVKILYATIYTSVLVVILILHVKLQTYQFAKWSEKIHLKGFTMELMS